MYIHTQSHNHTYTHTHIHAVIHTDAFRSILGIRLRVGSVRGILYTRV